MTTAANSPSRAVSGGESFPGVRAGDRLVWTMPDRARVFIRVVRLHGDYVYLRCHYGDKAWTRKHKLPLFPSMRRQHWTTDDLAETT